jgi:hypothetical protein
MPFCEGCGGRADDSHLARRSERLDLAKRFRPARIRVLFLDAAPPARIEDFFYAPVQDRTLRSLASRMFFDEVIRSAAAESAKEQSMDETKALAEFQRRGFFLSHAMECAFEDQADPQNALRRMSPSILKRVQELYNPSYIVPLSQPTYELIRLFGMIGWGERLILHKGGPFVDPYLGNPQRQAEMGTAFGERIKQALAALP